MTKTTIKRHLNLTPEDAEFIRSQACDKTIQSQRSGGRTVCQSDIVHIALWFMQAWPQLVYITYDGLRDEDKPKA